MSLKRPFFISAANAQPICARRSQTRSPSSSPTSFDSPRLDEIRSIVGGFRVTRAKRLIIFGSMLSCRELLTAVVWHY
jgi:hypothetical protein